MTDTSPDRRRLVMGVMVHTWGFDDAQEQQLLWMLAYQDVHRDRRLTRVSHGPSGDTLIL